MSALDARFVKSPLQMVGFYLAWVETAIGGGLWAISNVNDWPRSLMVVTMCIIGLLFAGTVAFVSLYLAIKKPYFLFNPSDYTPAVQPMLFGATEVLAVQNPPREIEKD